MTVCSGTGLLSQMIERGRRPLTEVDGRLYLSGLDPHLAERLRHTGRLKDPERMFEATPRVGESTEAARHAAQEWLVDKQPE